MSALDHPSTREQLLDVAERLFAERGYDAVSVREVTSGAGANLAAVSYHFGSKEELYVAAVRRAMEASRADEVWGLLAEPPTRRGEATARLAQFLRAFLARLLEGPEPNRCSRLMLLEAARPSAALQIVVERFVRPHEELLEGCVRAIAPGLDKGEARDAARSILAQPLHYLVFRPFVEKSRRSRLDDPRDVLHLADHIARFSLRGLGLGERTIDKAIAAAAVPEARARAESSREETSR